MSETVNVKRARLLRSRRMVLLGGSTLILSSASGTGQTVATEADTIVQPISRTDQDFITRAFEMKQQAVDRGDQPYGAAVVLDGAVVGQSWSRVVIDVDPTAHAELAAIRDASRRLQSRSLRGAVLYSSSRPCPMCEAAAYWAGISQMRHGRNAADAGAPRLCR